MLKSKGSFLQGLVKVLLICWWVGAKGSQISPKLHLLNGQTNGFFLCAHFFRHAFGRCKGSFFGPFKHFLSLTREIWHCGTVQTMWTSVTDPCAICDHPTQWEFSHFFKHSLIDFYCMWLTHLSIQTFSTLPSQPLCNHAIDCQNHQLTKFCRHCRTKSELNRMFVNWKGVCEPVCNILCQVITQTSC